jgi:Na+/H+ antiporter NhaD/arsenite permease-like protein
MMKIFAIVFIAYELYKLLTLKHYLLVMELVNLKVTPVIGDQWHLYINILYLMFAIALCFVKPIFGMSILALSFASSFITSRLRATRKDSHAPITVAYVADGTESLFILGMYILKG